MKYFSGDRASRRPCPSALKLALSTTVLLLSSCASVEPQPEVPASTPFPATVAAPAADAPAKPVKTKLTAADAAMLNNLAPVVAQIYDPIDTTVQINRGSRDPVLAHFIDLLTREGFGIQRVSADQGANFVTYSRTSKTVGGEKLTRFAVQIGAVSVERDYAPQGRNKVAPASKVRLSGTRAPVTVNDQPSDTLVVTDAALSGAQYVAALDLGDQSPIISLITSNVVNRVAQASIEKAPSLQALNSGKVEVNNLFYGNESTFSSVLDDYKKIERQVIVFGNDSMVLGDTNKALIDQFVESRMKQGDVVSLIGCSNGPTALAIGNEGLALGRAKRVTEALQARGIARANILDEGCWAPVRAGDRFPSRAVVMELWRKRS